ncbi:toll/interleukin-1 receptor domain-containing protein [Brachybacterium atlanticum]|uniref:toll/interleukin-1 receptor domain-containing protein n=1 Tax=Brachybacterium atlanticum TaxID=2911888 RepID=UPI0021E02543|nr:toll/interleukin-1 receptor domain-containing protein [Brachybacterium atlanticum]
MADLFVSYSWTSEAHKDWVRLLASSIQALGHEVLIDRDVDYGNGLTGFMQRVTECQRVLIVADDEYVKKADSVPGSGVWKESQALREVYNERPDGWLLVLLRDNPSRHLPAWLQPYDPKYISFNSERGAVTKWGEEQLEDIWRWMEGLSANRSQEVSAKELRERARRLELIEISRDPSNWRSPHLEGEVDFDYEHSPGKGYTFGFGQYEFTLGVSGCSIRSVYVYRDPVNISAVGIVSNEGENGDISRDLRPGRSVTPEVGQRVVLMNRHGALATVDLLDVTDEHNEVGYRPASIRFRWKVFVDVQEPGSTSS